MNQNRIPITRSVEKARWRLSHQGRRLVMILSIFVLLLSCMPYVFFYRALQSVFLVLPLLSTVAAALFAVAYALLSLLFTLLVLLPLFVGWMEQACRIARDEETDALLLFSAFSDGERYRAALRWGAALLIRVIPIAAVTVGTYLFSKQAFQGNLSASLLAALAILFELAVGLFILLQRFGFLFVVALDPRMPLRKARGTLKAFQKADRPASLRYFGYYFPRILLGIVTLGIYLIVDVLPMMATVYFCDWDARARALQQTDDEDSNLEDINDHE